MLNFLMCLILLVLRCGRLILVKTTWKTSQLPMMMMMTMRTVRLMMCPASCHAISLPVSLPVSLSISLPMAMPHCHAISLPISLPISMHIFHWPASCAVVKSRIDSKSVSCLNAGRGR